MEQIMNNQPMGQSAEPKLKTYIDDFFLMGFADQNGKIVIQAQWRGNVVIPCQWQYATRWLINGKAIVFDDNGRHTINKKGKIIK